MGVLKKITNEYFGESLRKEDGKYGTLAGHRVIMPEDYDDMMFLNEFRLPYIYRRCVKGDDSYGAKHIRIEGGEKSKYDLYMYDFNEFSYTKQTGVINEKMYTSFVDLLKDEMRDIEFDKMGNIVVKRGDILEKIADETGVNIGNLRLAVIYEYEEKFDFLLTSRTDIHVFCFEPSDSCILIDRTGYSGLKIEYTVFLSSIRNWFSDEIEKIREIGAENYVKLYKQKKLEKEKAQRKRKKR